MLTKWHWGKSENTTPESQEPQSGDLHPRSPNFSATLRVSRVSAASSVSVAAHCVTAATVGLRFLPPCLHSVLRSRAASGYSPDGLRARRKPRPTLRYDGST